MLAERLFDSSDDEGERFTEDEYERSEDEDDSDEDEDEDEDTSEGEGGGDSEDEDDGEDEELEEYHSEARGEQIDISGASDTYSYGISIKLITGVVGHLDQSPPLSSDFPLDSDEGLYGAEPHPSECMSFKSVARLGRN